MVEIVYSVIRKLSLSSVYHMKLKCVPVPLSIILSFSRRNCQSLHLVRHLLYWFHHFDDYFSVTFSIFIWCVPFYDNLCFIVDFSTSTIAFVSILPPYPEILLHTTISLSPYSSFVLHFYLFVTIILLYILLLLLLWNMQCNNPLRHLSVALQIL